MSSSILAVIFAVAILMAFATFSWRKRKDKMTRALLFYLALAIAIVLGLLEIGFESQSKKVYTSSELESSQTFKLVAFKNTSYYLIKDGDTYHYRYMDEDGEIKPNKIDAPECEVAYDKNAPKLTMGQMRRVYHEEWLFITGKDGTSTEPSYNFVVPNEESVLDLNDS